MTDFLQDIGAAVLVLVVISTVGAAFIGAIQALQNEKDIRLHADKVRALERSKGDHS